MKENRLLLLLVFTTCLTIVFSVLPYMVCFASEQRKESWVFKLAEYSPDPTAAGIAAARPKAMEWWGNEVEKRTNGRVKIEWYWSGSLLPEKVILDGTRKRLCDIGSWVSIYYPANMPLTEIGSSPGLSGRVYCVSSAFLDAYEKFPEYQDEFDKRNNVKNLLFMGLESHQFLTTKEIRSLSDLKGLRIRSFGGFVTLMKEMGVVPVSMTGPDMYMALERGTIDGLHHPVENMAKYKTYEVAKYYTKVDIGAVLAIGLAMNLDLWNSLPSDIQGVFTKIRREYIDVQTRVYDEYTEKQLKILKDAGVKFHELSESEKQLIHKLSLPIQEKYARELDAKGLPGTKMTNFVRERINYYETKQQR